MLPQHPSDERSEQRRARVLELQRRVRCGEYPVDADLLAARMLADGGEDPELCH
jgi:anti-sigma28 factor (negative regulator of flagellin synthesis)